MKANEVTKAAFSIAIGVAILTVGFHLTFGEYFWYFWATLMISFPDTGRGKVCTFIGTGILGFLLCGQYVYMCSYLLWLGPYILVWCLTEKYKSRNRYFLLYMVFWAGALTVMWTTPMLFVRLSTVSGRTKLIGVIILSAACAPACLGYTILYRNMRNFLKERVLR